MKNRKFSETKQLPLSAEIQGKKYSLTNTQNHPKAKDKILRLKEISDVLQQEGGKGDCFNGEVCFKLDEADKEARSSQVHPAVDVAFCLNSGNVLLVEAKFKVISPKSFPTVLSHCIKKINGSIQILSEPPMVERYSLVVLVQKKAKAIALSSLYRLNDWRCKKFAVMTESEFHDAFF